VSMQSSWVTKPARLACEKIQDGTHFSPKNQLSAGPYPYVTAKNVRPWGLDLANLTYLEEEEHRPIYDRSDARKGDVLLVKDGVNAGDVAINSIEGEISLLSSVCFLRPKEDLRAQFLRYYLQSPQCQAFLLGELSGSAIRRIILRKIRELPIIIAPLDEQDAIVAELDKQLSRLDETSATLRAIQTKLKQARASILKAAVEGRLVETDTPWSTKPLRELLAEPMRNGKSAKTSTSGKGVRIATLTAVTANQFTESNTKPADLDPSELDDLWLQPEDIFVQRSNAPELVGTSAMYSGQPNWAIFPDLLIRVRCSPEILPKWMLANLQAPSTRRYFKENAKGSSGSMPKISQSVIAEAVIACPSLKDQEATLEELERRFSVVDQVEETVNASLRRCGQLRQAVLKRAFGG
jgi:type I restriction enzyme S subunit